MKLSQQYESKMQNAKIKPTITSSSQKETSQAKRIEKPLKAAKLSC
jgi:hypothetical protein